MCLCVSTAKARLHGEPWSCNMLRAAGWRSVCASPCPENNSVLFRTHARPNAVADWQTTYIASRQVCKATACASRVMGNAMHKPIAKLGACMSVAAECVSLTRNKASPRLEDAWSGRLCKHTDGHCLATPWVLTKYLWTRSMPTARVLHKKHARPNEQAYTCCNQPQ